MKFHWKKRGLIFCTDKLKDWSKSHSTLPTPYLINDTRLRIFYTTRDQTQQSRMSFIDVNPNNPKEILYIHDKPLMELGGLGTFDDKGMTSSQIIELNGENCFYYNGYNIATTARYRVGIGLAVFNSAMNELNRKFDGPIMDRTIYDPCGTATPFILKEEGLFKMWYASFQRWKIIDGDPEPFYTIKHATSNDGISWVVNEDFCIDFEGEEGGIVRPTVMKIDAYYYMWFSARKNTKYRDNVKASYRIGFAKSLDGINWARKDEDFNLNISEGEWDGDMMAYPYVIKVKDRIYMFYNGNGFGQSGFGYAELEINKLKI